MDRFQTSTFMLEILLTGLAMTALGCAGVMVPVLGAARSCAPSAAEIEAIADARMARLRTFLRLNKQR